MTTAARLPSDLFQADPETRAKNALINGQKRFSDECFLCGRGMTDAALRGAWHIHMSTMGDLIPNVEGDTPAEGSDSQGCFPVGSECAKKIPVEYRFRYTDEEAAR